LADLSHRLHYIQTKPKDWDSFFKACVDDAPIHNVITLYRDLSLGGLEDISKILITGRSSDIRGETEEWLKKHHIYHDGLYMRDAGDHRPDNIVKSELLDLAGETWDLAEVIGIFEDRKQVVDMYRNRGFRVFQVAEGDF